MIRSPSNVAVNTDAQAAIDELTCRITQLAESIDAPKLLKQLFCQTLDWQYVNDPVPMAALPAAMRKSVIEAVILAKCEQFPLCYVRMCGSELNPFEQRWPLDRLARAWPGVLVAFGNFGQNQIDFCYKLLDGRIVRISLDRGLFGAEELAQAIYAMRAYDVRPEEAAQIQERGRPERQMQRAPRPVASKRGLDCNPIFRELRRHRQLTQEEENRLQGQFTAGQRHAARDKLVFVNLRLAVSAAYRYRGFGVAWDDLLQEGAIGLLQAADKYGPGTGLRFTTYAALLVMQRVLRTIAEQAPLVATPVPWFQRVRKLRQFSEKFIHDNGFAPSDCDIREKLGLSNEQLFMLLQARSAWNCRQGVSDKIPCGSAVPENQEPRNERDRKIDSVLRGRMDERMVEVIRRRFGLGGRTEETLEHIGESLDLTRERVRQIERDALSILRHPQQARQLESYVDP